MYDQPFEDWWLAIGIGLFFQLIILGLSAYLMKDTLQAIRLNRASGLQFICFGFWGFGVVFFIKDVLFYFNH